MRPTKIGRDVNGFESGIVERLDTDRHTGSFGDRSEKDTADEAFETDMPGSDSSASRRSANSDPRPTDQVTIKTEDDSDTDGIDAPGLRGAEPDLFWIKEWSTMDLKSAIASQVDFFKTGPRFNHSNTNYVYFFLSIEASIRRAKASNGTITKDATASANLTSLQVYFEDFAHTSRRLLRHDLERIRVWDYSQCRTILELENTLQGHSDFLSLTRLMASLLALETEWMALWTAIRAAKKNVVLAKQQGSFGDAVSSVQAVQPARPSTYMGGPLSPELLEMDYEFTDAIWSQWIDGCISYFGYWTADPPPKIPAEDYIRHLSHYRLAMELFLKHRSISDLKHSTLLTLAKKYMRQYCDYTTVQLERKYAILKEDVKEAEIYRTEARFWQLADDLEVLMNEPPEDIPEEAWNDAVPAMLAREKVLAARNAVNVLYKEFQTKRYPEDEVVYLWWLTWRNIKHLLPYLTSPFDLDALQPGAEGQALTIEARDLALPFVEKNFSHLLTIVRKDNDALYQKEIESLVGDYCVHIDKYVRGKGEGQERLYKQFNRLSRTKRVPFVFLVNLEESLLKAEVPPTNASQMVAHRVVMRLNHIMEGPRDFKRWEITESGALRTYKPTLTWIKEQQGLSTSRGFSPDDVDETSFSRGPSAYQEGAGAGGGDDGDGGDKRNPFPEASGESDSSEEEVEEESPGGTKRKVMRKKAKATPKQLGQLIHSAERPDSDFTSGRSGAQADTEDEEEDDDDQRMSGLHPVPANSVDYHRRRLELLRVEQQSAVPNAQYPLPETAAPQRAAALQIARELADPGIFTDGPRPEDVQNYINPALRLPLTEDDLATRQEERQREPRQIRRSLNRLRDTLGGPFFGASAGHPPPRATPHIPESNAQRVRREREAREATPRVLKRQPDRYSVTKSRPRDGRPRHAAHNVPSTNDLGEDASGFDPDLPWSRRNQGENAEASVGGGPSAARENQTPSGNPPARDSNPKGESPAKSSDQENQEPRVLPQPARGNADDWNTPSPPRQYDNHIYERSPIRTPGTPTPGQGGRPKPTGRPRLPARRAADGHAGHRNENLRASPPRPPSEDGPSSQLRALNHWISVEIASNNRDMRAAYLLHRELVRHHSASTMHYLYEMLRAHVEMATFNDYVFEREVTFGPAARARIRRGAPSTVQVPSTPRAQIDPASEWWWNDRFEGTRYGIRRPGVPGSNGPPEEGEVIEDSQEQQEQQRAQHGFGTPGRGNRKSEWTPVSPSPIRDDYGNPIPWEVLEDRVPLGEVITTSAGAGSDDDRTWRWRPHPSTGLPEREFNIYIEPDIRPRRDPHDLGEPLLVQDPLNPGQLTTNPRFDPDILRLISAAGSGDHGQINVRVPRGWRINVGPHVPATYERTRSQAPSPSGSTSGTGPVENQVTVTSPGFAIHEDPPSGSSVRDRSNAPPTLGLVDRPQSQQQQQQQPLEDVIDTIEEAEQPWPRVSDQLASTSSSTSTSTIDQNQQRGKIGSNGSSSGPTIPESKSHSPPSPRSTTTTTTTATAPAPPWYSQWHTSTLTRLRAELRRRGIPARGLTLKQHMIDRLKEDDRARAHQHQHKQQWREGEEGENAVGTTDARKGGSATTATRGRGRRRGGGRSTALKRKRTGTDDDDAFD